MGIQDLPDEVLLITLPREPQQGSELDFALEIAQSRGDRHVIVDFSLVEMMPSATLGGLMLLEWVLGGIDRRLILCSASPCIVEVFRRVGLDDLFGFAADRFAALQSLDRVTCSRG